MLYSKIIYFFGLKMKFKKPYDKYFPYIFIFLFLTLSILLITRHELWRDEVHVWNIANNSNSFSQLFYYMKQSEGHPYLWHIILYFISHFISKNIESIKVIHLIFSTVTAFLILKFSPFNKTIKVLLVFSYFFFYEYSIISRNYAIGVLLIIVFCIMYKNKYKNILPISIILLLMGSCNIYSFLISILFSALLLFDFIKDRKTELKNTNKLKLVISIIIIIFGIVLVYFQIGSQLLKNSFTKEIGLNLIFKNIISKSKSIPEIILNSYIPIPEININFWNTNLIYNQFESNTTLLIVIIIVLVSLSIFILKNKFKIVFFGGFLLLISFILLFYFGFLRHWGHIFLLFIACLWMSQNEITENSLSILKFKKTIINVFLLLILIGSLFGSSIAFYFDYKYQFSNGKKVAEYIDKNFDTNNLIIVGIPDAQTETITGYLNKSFYYPQEKRFGTNVLWDNKKNITLEDIFIDIEKLKSENSEKEFLIIKDNYSTISSLLTSNLLLLNKFLPEQNFIDSIVIDEGYELFKLNKNLKIRLIKEFNLNEFESYWQRINNCKIESINNGKVYIRAETNDPNFESNFLIPKVSINKKLLLKIKIESIEFNEMTLYYRRTGSNYSEEDKSTNILIPGLNIIVFEITNPNNIERIRLDPVNIKTDFTIESIEFYELYQEE